MKLKVIGWTYYEDDTFPVGELTWAAKYAVLPDLKECRFLSEGDRITLVFDKETATYNVTAVERKKDVSYTLSYQFKYRCADLFTEEQKAQIEKAYLDAGNKIIVKLSYCVLS